MAKQLISIRISDATRAKLDQLATRYGTQTEVVAVALDRLYQQEVAMTARVTITDDGLHCQGCGKMVSAEYKQQDPAPCGCAWVWNESTQRLEAVPSRK